MYASKDAPSKKRLTSIRMATKETAKLLNLDFEMIRFGTDFSQIYVYYEYSKKDDPIPLYCDEGKVIDLEEICSILRRMVFVLSFHPKHSALKQVRDLVMRAS